MTLRWFSLAAVVMQGFIPYSKLDAERVYGQEFEMGATMQSMDQESLDDMSNSPRLDGRPISLQAMEGLIGTVVRAKVVQVRPP